MLRTLVILAPQNLRFAPLEVNNKSVTYTCPFLQHRTFVCFPWNVCKICCLHLFFLHHGAFVFSPWSIRKHVTYTGPFCKTEPWLSPWNVCRTCYLHCSFWNNRTFVFNSGMCVEHVTYTGLFCTTEPSWNVGRQCYIHCSLSTPEHSLFTLECK